MREALQGESGSAALHFHDIGVKLCRTGFQPQAAFLCSAPVTLRRSVKSDGLSVRTPTLVTVARDAR